MIRPTLRIAKEKLFLQSLKSAALEQNLTHTAQQLMALGGVDEQYTDQRIDTEYLRSKVLYQNAFQINFTLPDLPQTKGLVVDIGDSSGRHIQALKALKPDCNARFLSANLDETAIAKIRAKGLEAVLSRAEDLAAKGLEAEVFLLFETLEHMPNPFGFLHDLAFKSNCRRLILTVPWVKKSRLGLHHIRQQLTTPVTAEKVHLLELCPEDLRLLFAFTGWKVEREQIYRQYPLYSPLLATKAAWQKLDFEGFYAASLSRDDSWSKLYLSW